MLSKQQLSAKRRLYYPVLCYHGCVLNQADVNTYWEYIEDFKKQIQNLKNCGYVFVKPSVYLSWHNGSYDPPEPIACIHVDDGLEIARPLFEWMVAGKIPFGMALIARRQRKHLPEEGFIDWASIQSYVAAGYGEVLCHTYNMHSLALKYDSDSSTVVSAPILEGPSWIDNGAALHVYGGDTRYAWDYSHTDDCWGLPIWGVDPYDGTTKISTTVTFTPASGFSLHVIRLFTTLTVPGGTGYAVQVEVFLNAVSCGTVTVNPKQYGLRSQWPEREFITMILPTPHTVNSGIPNTLTFETKNTGGFMMRVYFKPDSSSTTSASTNCQSLQSGITGPTTIDRPASYSWLGHPLMILGDGTGSTVSDGTFTGYVEDDLETYQSSVQDWLKATWSYAGNPQVLGNSDNPCFGTQSGSALTSIFQVLVTSGQTIDVVQLHMTTISGSQYSATVALSVAATLGGTYTEVYRGAAKWVQSGNAEYDVTPFTTSGTIMYLKVVSLEVCPTVWGTNNYSRIVFDGYTDKGGNPQILGDGDLPFIGTQSSAALTTIFAVDTASGISVDTVQVHLTANFGSSYSANVKISVGPTSGGAWTQIFLGPIQWVTSDTTNYHTDFFTTPGTTTYFKFETQSTSGANNYSRIVKDSDTGKAWIKVGLFQKAWIKFGQATKLASPIPNQFIYPFGSSYDAGSGAFVLPDFTRGDIAPPLKTALATSCSCGYDIVPRRAIRASEMTVPDLRVTEWLRGREIMYGTAPNATSMQHQRIYGGAEWPDVDPGTVIWSTALEPDPDGNASIHQAVGILKEVHFDSYYFELAGVITKQEMNDGGSYISVNGDTQVGDFVLGETITGGTSGATAMILFYEDLMAVAAVTGTFQPLETITGGTSSATVALDERGLKVYADEKTYLLNNNVEIYLIFNNLSSGEPDPDIGSYVVNNPSSYITQMVDFVVDQGWTGCMFDAEAIPEDDQAAATNFIQLLYQALVAVGKKLCVAVPLRTGTSYDDGSEDWWGWCDHAAIAPYCHQMLVESYVETGPGTLPGPHCSDIVFEQCYEYMKATIPQEHWIKIRVGANSYGHYWPNRLSEDDVEDNSYHLACWNATYGVAPVTIVDSEGRYEDTFGGEGWFGTPQTVQRAVDTATKKGLGGVFIWKADDGDVFEFWPSQTKPILSPDFIPALEDYSFTLPDNVNRAVTSGGISRYSLIYEKALQTFDINYEVSLSKLDRWNDFYFNEITKGLLDFYALLDSGTGVEQHLCTLIPSSVKIDRQSHSANISLQLAAETKLYGLTPDEVLDELSEWQELGLKDYTGGMTFTSRFPYLAPNDSLQRFDARYWNVDFRLGSVATIVASTATSFTVNAAFRSNIDLVGVIWSSLDRYGHPVLRYDTNKDYTNTIFAFVANPPHPYDFSLTVAVGSTSYIYRLFPYKNTAGTLSCDVTDPGSQGPGTGLTYAASTLFPSGLTVPGGSQIYIIDFSNLNLGFSFDGALIPVNNIDSIFMALVPDGYGIGLNAVLANAVAANLTEWHITGVPTTFRIQAGDVVTVTYTQGATFHTVPVTVTTWSGDGTTERFLTMATPMTGVTWTGGKCIATVFSLDSPLGNVDIAFTVQNISITGSNSTIGKYNYPQIVNGMRMTTGFDDTYNITPWRQVDQIYALGYRGDVVCYMGASHYYKAMSSLVSSVYYNLLDTTVGSSPLNLPTVAWCNSFFAALASKGLGFIWSTSLEILLSQTPPDWAQKDVDDVLAQSGYTPPTSFLNFIVPDVLTYLENVIKQGLGLVQSAGLGLKVQLGEWWSWDGSYTNGKPSIYAYATKVAYNDDTGLFAPTTITSIYKDPITSEERAYCEWLGARLGAATGIVRDAVKATYSGAQFCLLFFSPQIFNDASVILPLLNFPSTYWSYPNYDFMQIEDYDWVIAGEFEKLAQTIEAATILLKYPVNTVHYFIGFVNKGTDQHVWNNIHIALAKAIDAGLTYLYVWAYPQIIRDGIVDDPRLPAGILPTVNPGGYSHTGTDGIYRSGVRGSVPVNAKQWLRGQRTVSLTLSVSQEELRILLIFIYFKVSLGAITFTLPVSDGQDIHNARVNIVPGTINVRADGYRNWIVAMDVEGEDTHYA